MVVSRELRGYTPTEDKGRIKVTLSPSYYEVVTVGEEAAQQKGMHKNREMPRGKEG